MVSLPDLKRRGDDGQPLVTIDDVADMNEILIVDAENQRRAQKAAENKSRAKGK